MSTLTARRIIDSHIHFWDNEAVPVPWLDGLSISGRHDPSGVPSSIDDVPVTGVVFVQAEAAADRSLDEVRWVESLGAQHPQAPPVLGIVARAALESPVHRDEVEALRDRPSVVGVRRNVQGEDAGFAAQLRDGLATLADADYAFDLCVTDDQLREVADLIDGAPEGGRYVLDHVGKPQVGVAAARGEWRAQLGRLAAHDSVWCKLSGLFTEVREGAADVATIGPYLEVAIETFGTERVMYGSDWPVSTLAERGYEEWVRLLATVLGPDQALQDAVFADNAATCYRLGEATA